MALIWIESKSKFIHGISSGNKTFCFGMWCHGIIIAVDIYDNRQMDLMGFGFQLIVVNVRILINVSERASEWAVVGVRANYWWKRESAFVCVWSGMYVFIVID